MIVGNVDVRQPTTFAQPALDNTGTKDLVLDSARVIPGKGSPHQVTVEKYLIGLPSRPNGGGGNRGEPDPAIDGPWSSVAGTVIKPLHSPGTLPNGYSLIVVTRLDMLGRGWTDGIEIRYHVGNTHYIARSDSRYVVCTPLTGRTLDQLHHCGDGLSVDE